MSSASSSSYSTGSTSFTSDHPPNGKTNNSVITAEPLLGQCSPSAPDPSQNNALSHRGHAEELVGYLYHTGFRDGNFSDIILQVNQQIYRLHSIILSRSPYLAHLMSTRQMNAPLYIQFDHASELTEEGFAIAMGYLYSSESLALIRVDNARSVLAAGCRLGSMDELCQYAYEVCKQSISIDTLDDWLRFVDRLPGPDELGPLDPQFYEYARHLRDDILHFLVMSLPTILGLEVAPNNASSPVPRTPVEDAYSAGQRRQELLNIYSRVPFDMFKAAIESPEFHIGSDQARFKFAKDAIGLRKKGIARGTGADETVVLQFGGVAGAGGLSAVHVTRKKRKRELYKIGSA